MGNVDGEGVCEVEVEVMGEGVGEVEGDGV